MRYMPALDGLRALAVALVVLLHCRVPGFGGGGIGVDVFFVLSGYLITRVLVEHRPTLGSFYLHRAMRLMPPLLLLLAVYLAVFPLLVTGHPHGRDALLAALYVSDYSFAFAKEPTYLAHTWSLSVEEHFYLIWPIVLYSWRPSVRALLVAYAVALAWRWIPEHTGAYFRFDTRMTALLAGCILARFPRDVIPSWPGVVGILVLCLIDPGELSGRSSQAVAGVAVEAASAVAIIGRAPAWLAAPSLQYIGRISYGIYLWHLPIAKYLRDDIGLAWPWLLASTAAISVSLAALSYHTVEAWFRRARRSGRPRLAGQS